MNRSFFETTLGIIVLIVAIVFFGYGYQFIDRLKDSKTYTISLYSNNVGGLKKGGNVQMAGVVIGRVAHLDLDDRTYRAQVTLTIENNIRLPQDTKAEIVSKGFLGDMYVRLISGTSSSFIKNGGVIKNVQDAQTLEEVLGKLIFTMSQ